VKAARFLTLLVIGVGAAAARAQSPLMYYPPPYAPRSPGYGSAAPAYPAPAYAAPRGQRQTTPPRVMYVPANPAPWWGETIVSPPQAIAAPSVAAPSVAAPSVTAPVPGAPATPINDGDVDAVPPSLRGNAVSAGAPQGEIIIGSTLEGYPGNGFYAPGPAADPAHCDDDHDHDREWLPRGCCSLQILSGYYANVSGTNYDWIPVHFRLGHVCNGRWHGAFEPILDLTTGLAVNNDFGDWFIGPALILRYNFAQPGTPFVPYVQAGVGFQYNDAYRDANSVTGSRIQLTAQAQAGFRLFLRDNLSFDFEGGLQHISNANMSERDEDLNALGATAGFSYFFGRGRR
jgi:hypothetical protein